MFFLKMFDCRAYSHYADQSSLQYNNYSNYGNYSNFPTYHTDYNNINNIIIIFVTSSWSSSWY